MADRWNDRAYLQPMQFEYEDKPTEREVRLHGRDPRPGDPARITVAGVEVEAWIVDVADSILHVRVGRRLF